MSRSLHNPIITQTKQGQRIIIYNMDKTTLIYFIKNYPDRPISVDYPDGRKSLLPAGEIDLSLQG